MGTLRGVREAERRGSFEVLPVNSIEGQLFSSRRQSTKMCLEDKFVQHLDIFQAAGPDRQGAEEIHDIE